MPAQLLRSAGMFSTKLAPALSFLSLASKVADASLSEYAADQRVRLQELPEHVSLLCTASSVLDQCGTEGDDRYPWERCPDPSISVRRCALQCQSYNCTATFVADS